MPTDLTSAQVNKLKAKGFSITAIKNFQTGKVTGLMADLMAQEAGVKLNQQLRTGTTRTTNPQYGVTPGYSSPMNRAPLPTASSGGKPKSASTVPSKIAPKKSTPTTTTRTTPKPPYSGPLGNPFQDLIQNAARTAAGTIGTRKAATPAGGAGSVTYGGDIPYPDMPGYEGGQYEIPVITPRDFIDQARGLVDQAMAPLFAQLEASKGNLTKEGERSRKIVGGLYEKMVGDIATTAAEQANQYKAQEQAATQQGQDLSSEIAKTYQGAQSNTADVLGKLGIQAAAPEVLSEQTADQGWQQGQALTNAGANQQYFAQQGQGQADYNTQLGNITKGEGVVAQQDILHQVAQGLQGIDANIANQRAESGRMALDINQNLTSQDLAAQQANAGYQMQGNEMSQSDAQFGTQLAQQAALARYEADINNRSRNDTLAQQDYENQYRAGQDTIRNQLERESLNAQINAAGAKAGAGPEPAGLEKVRQQYANTNGGLKAFDLALFEMQNWGNTANPMDYGQFVAKIRNQAIQQGVPQDLAAQVASDIYRAQFGTG